MEQPAIHILDRIASARTRPMVACSDCGRLKCYDYPGVHICNECHDRAEQIKADREKKNSIAQAIEDSGLPDRFKQMTWKIWRETVDPCNRHIEAIARGSYADPKGLRIYGEKSRLNPGGVGQGKSLLLAALTVAYCRVGHWPLYINANDLAGTLERTRFDKNPTRNFTNASVLLIDEFTFENPPSSYVIGEFAALFDRIYAEGRTKLYLAGNTPSDAAAEPSIRSIFNFRTASRISLLTNPVLFKGPDLRLKQTSS